MNTLKQLLLALALMTTGIMLAQGPDCPKISEMHAHKFKFLTERAQLTPKEAETIEPFFMEFEVSIWEIHKKNHHFFKSINKDGGQKTNYEAMNNRYIDSEVKQVLLLKKYHLQIRKLISPETLFRYYKAEREFKRQLMMDMRDKKPRREQP